MSVTDHLDEAMRALKVLMNVTHDNVDSALIAGLASDAFGAVRAAHDAVARQDGETHL